MFALWRIVTILLGYAAAIATTIIGLHLFMDILGWLTRPPPIFPSPPITVERIWKYVLLLLQSFFPVGAGTAALPAFVVVIISESRAWRTIRPYAWGGAIVGAVCHIALLLSLLLSAHRIPYWSDRIFLVVSIFSVMAIGAMAGTVYWLIAGRNAGRWRWADAPDIQSGRRGAGNRLASIGLGYLVAYFAAALALISFGLVFFGIPISFPWTLLVAFGVWAAFSILPAGAVIIYAEKTGCASLLFYLLSGIAVVAITVLPLAIYQRGFGNYLSSFSTPAGYLTVILLVLSGCVAGATYWAVAGRNAGQWREAQVQ